MAFVPFILFTNFMVSLDQIPVWIRWPQWIDPYKYVVDALAITEYRGQVHPGYNGPEYLKELDAGYWDTYLVENYINSWLDSVYFDWIMLVILIFGFRFIVWLILVKRNGF